MSRPAIKTPVPLILLVLLTACGKTGHDGLDALVSLQTEAAGDHCPYGGTRVDSGRDRNGNGILDTDEIEQTGYVCNGLGGAGWQLAGQIERLSPTYSDAYAAGEPQVAMDDQGRGLAVWEHSTGTGNRLWANRYHPETGWQAQQPIDTTGDGNTLRPDLAMNGIGDAVAAWQRDDGTHTTVWVNRFDAATESWAGAQRLDTAPDSEQAVLPKVGMDAAGNAIVLWRQTEGGTHVLYTSRFDGGAGTWSAPTPIQAGEQEIQGWQLAVGSGGTALAVWLQRGSDNQFHVWASRFDGTWQTAEALEDGTEGRASDPQAAVAANGDAVVVWTQSNQVFARRFVDDAWEDAQVLSDRNEPFAPQVVMDGEGNALALWSQYEFGLYRLWARRLDAQAGTWDTPQPVETGDGDAEYAHLAMNADGTALAVWQANGGLHTDILANRYLPGLGWGRPQLLEWEAADAYEPRVALDPQGNALAVWEQTGARQTRIWGNRYIAP